LALYPMDHRHNTAVWVWFPITTVLSVLLSRLIHWYSHIEQYGSLLEAMTDYSTGGYCVQGIILGAVFAALLVKLIRLTPTAGELLDAAAPGMALCLALIRLSSLFNTNCRGRIVITDKLFQHLPYASQKAFEWVAAADEMHQLCGYLLLARLFMQGNPLMRQSEVEYMDQASAALGSRSLAVRKAAYDSLMKYSLIGAEQEALVNKVMCSLESAAN